MSKYDDLLAALQRADKVNLILGKRKSPLKNIRPLRELRDLGTRDWLYVQLGRAAMEHHPELEKRILELLEILSRKRGRPRKEKATPQAIGRPKKWTMEHQEDWLITLDETNHSAQYINWLKYNAKRNCESSRILYVLESILTAQGQRNVKSTARRRLRTYQNMISSARQLSRKPPE